MKGYPIGLLRREVAYIAYFFHWPQFEILDMDHRTRRQWVGEIAAINDRLNGASE